MKIGDNLDQGSGFSVNLVYFFSLFASHHNGKMLRRPDTPVLPKSASRMAVFGTAVVSFGFILSMSDKDANGREHVFSPIIRASKNALSFGFMSLEIKAIDAVIAKKKKEEKEQALASPVDSQ